jgi:hypothetical protein
MIKRGLGVLGLLSLAWAGCLQADAAAPLSATAAVDAPVAAAVSGVAADSTDPDVYYAPEENGDASGEMGGSQGAVGSLPGSASYLSHARVVPFEWGHPDKPLDGVDLFLNDHYVGSGTLTLDGYLVQRDALGLTAHKDGYEEALRPQVRVPMEGDLRVALLSDNAASWTTTPGWVIGLGLVVGSLLTYNSNGGNTGLGLLGGGVGVIAVTQLIARFIQMPALRHSVETYNQKQEPAP